jgi:hypothetical protein
MKDIRTLETTDGLYVSLSDIINLVAKLCYTYPSFALWHLFNLLKKGDIVHEKTGRNNS